MIKTCSKTKRPKSLDRHKPTLDLTMKLLYEISEQKFPHNNHSLKTVKFRKYENQ